jgi:hypothetical protein
MIQEGSGSILTEVWNFVLNIVSDFDHSQTTVTSGPKGQKM